MTEEIVTKIIESIGGEDPGREGLAGTPGRVARAWGHLMQGYAQDPGEILGKAVFTETCDQMVIVRDIEVYSMCEHHMLPFFGKCHIGYIAKGRVYGVSKLARLVDCFSRRLQLQERLTRQVAEALMGGPVGAEGVGVIIEAQHLCMMMRGVSKQNSVMVTSSMLGSFRDEPAARAEFLQLTGSRKE